MPKRLFVLFAMLAVTACQTASTTTTSYTNGVTPSSNKTTDITIRVDADGSFTCTFLKQTISSAGDFVFRSVDLGDYQVAGLLTGTRVSFTIQSNFDPSSAPPGAILVGSVKNLGFDGSSTSVFPNSCGVAYTEAAQGHPPLNFKFQFTVVASQSLTAPPCYAH